MEGQRFLLLINTQLLKRGINEIEILIFGSGAVWLETGEALNYRTEERTGVPSRAARLGWWWRPGRAQ